MVSVLLRQPFPRVGLQGTASRNTTEHSKMVSVLLRQPFQGLVYKGQLQGTQRNTSKWCRFFSGTLFQSWFSIDSFKEHNGTLQNGVGSSQAPFSRVGLKGQLQGPQRNTSKWCLFFSRNLFKGWFTRDGFKEHNETLQNGVCSSQATFFSRVGFEGTASRNTTEHFKMVSVLLRQPFQGLVYKGQLQGPQRNTSKWCLFFSRNLFKGWFTRDGFKEHNETLQNGVCSSQATFFSRVGFEGTASRNTTEHFKMVSALLRHPFQGLVLKGQLQGPQRNTSKWCLFFSGNLFKGWF